MVMLLQVNVMISYRPFYETLLKRGISEYHLIYKEGFSANILHRMKHGKNITLKTLDTLCFILDCDISDIIEYVKDK
jgi:DNA-binding Xre family transcriptional regulator